mgnify:CR=1 FL=1
MSEPRLRVKVVGSVPETIWLHQFPHGEPVWGACAFVFDRAATDYDWLLVYDDLPARAGEAKKTSREALACPRAHTLLVTSEPSSVKIYGDAYTHQFGAVLTSQPEWALPHPQRIFSQPALQWFYGVGSHAILPFDSLLNMVRTVPNATCNLAVAVTTARFENAIDEQVFNHRPTL